jgi:CRISPR-associated protein Csx16
VVKMNEIIVSRHEGAVAWLREIKGVTGKVIPHFDEKVEVKGKKVYGTLPVHLIKQIIDREGEFYLINLPSVAFSQRGKELTPSEMEEAGAQLLKIKKVELEVV